MSASRVKKKRKRLPELGAMAGPKGDETGENVAVTYSLDEDTMLNILHRVPTRALLSVMALVCRRWRRLCQEHLVHDLTPPLYSTHDKPWGSLTDMQIMELVKRHASTLQSIEFRGLKQLTADDVQDIFTNLPRLQHLTFASDPPVITNNLQNLVHQLPGQLVTLDVHTTGFSTSVFSNPNSRPLPPTITDDFVGALCQRCPQLERLTLDADSLISEASFDRLLQTWPSLTLLHINSTALGWSSVLHIFQSCQCLQDLSLCSSKFAIPPKIEADKAGYSDGVEVAEMYSKKILSDLMPQSLVSLRLYVELHVSVRWDLIPAEDLMRFKGHQLRQLHAQNSFQLAWHNISVWCTNLKTLDLSRAHHHNIRLTEEEGTKLCRLVKHLVQLEELALPAASDRILSELGRSCPRLRRLFFQGWRMHRAGPLTKQLDVTDRGVSSLAEGCSELRVLSLGGCNKITTSAIRILTYHCKKIEVLELTGCTSLTDEAIVIVLTRLGSSLLLLDLLNCTKLTSGVIRKVLDYALTQGISLRVLTIPNSIKSASRSLLSQLNRKLPFLSVRGNNNGLHWDGFYHCPPWSYCS
ncbi:hypothetical protein M758_2G019600 [Ceratodon purpureus]|uniref:F-box domain-containing protein n=1 Tax=Ceratodon purpureus TaxID=3225 RepID=A0A8T0IR78_CERPU|nr:hypothetical protein KC19_2G020500 [Ceratodon purpureus]KAG0624998.1 hypothetical protein M758_2G019600 [Ceratodon purpureus]